MVEFTLLDTQYDGVTHDYSGVWSDGTYIYVTCDYDGLRAYSFDGSNLTLLDTQADGGHYKGVWSDGTYIYVASSTKGIRAYSFDGSNFTLLATLDDGGYYAQVWSDGTYIYVTTDGWYGLRAYSFDGSNFTLLDTLQDGSGTYWGVWCDVNYIYVACGGDGIRAYSFDGSDFTLLDTQDDGGSYWGVWSDGTYIYAACTGSGIRAYSFDGSNFTLLDTQDDGGTYYDVWGDGTYIYTACGTSGIRAYSFDGSDFTLLTSKDDGGEYWDVWGDGTYIYAACGDDGLRVYSFVPPNNPPDTPTSDMISTHVVDSSIYLIWLHDNIMASDLANNFALGSGDIIYYKTNLEDSWSTYTVEVSPDVSIVNGTYLLVQPDSIVNTYISIITTLDVYVTDPDSDAMTVSFYWSDDTLIKQVAGVASGSTAKTDALSLDYDTSYSYYILIDDGINTPVRVDKSFTTMLEPVAHAWGLTPGAMAKMMGVI